VGWRSFLAWWRLRRAAAASWYGLFARRTRGGRLLHVGPLRELKGPEDTELSHRYALFRGRRQFPPLPVSHDAIAEGSHAAYSIWSGHCLFKSTGRWGGRLHHYWVVEQTPSTRQLMPMVVDILEPPTARAAQNFFDQLREKILVQPPCAATALKRGDRVVVFTHSLQPGGAERQWCYLAIGLKEQGFKVSFVVHDRLEGDKSHYRSLLMRYSIAPIEIARHPVGKALRRVPRDCSSRYLLEPQAGPFDIRLLQLAAYFVEVRPQAVFAQLDTVNLMSGVASVIADVPRCVLSFRNFNPTNFPYLRNEWYLPCYQALVESPRIILSGNSHAANSDYAAWLNVSADRVKYIPNAIEPQDFDKPSPQEIASLRTQLGLTADMPVILGVFRLSEEKDPRTFVQVCASAMRSVPGVRVLIAGVGSLQTEVETMVKALGLEGSVTLLGRRTDVPALMSISSLLLLTSTHEGMPNVVMEAQLFGLPVVATRAGGTSDIVVDGITGYMRPVGDVSGLTEACVTILLNRSLRHSMQSASKNRMLDGFSKQTMVDRYVAIASEPTLSQTTADDSEARRKLPLGNNA